VTKYLAVNAIHLCFLYLGIGKVSELKLNLQQTQTKTVASWQFWYN